MEGSFATRAVDGTRFTDVRWVAETGSTNKDLLNEAAEGAPEGIVLVADHQTAGRGRLERVAFGAFACAGEASFEFADAVLKFT